MRSRRSKLTSAGCAGDLRGANEAEVREIVDELRSHILDKAAASEEARGEITVPLQWTQRWPHWALPKNWPAST
jgi:hypothetical protein